MEQNFCISLIYLRKLFLDQRPMTSPDIHFWQFKTATFRFKFVLDRHVRRSATAFINQRHTKSISFHSKYNFHSSHFVTLNATHQVGEGLARHHSKSLKWNRDLFHNHRVDCSSHNCVAFKATLDILTFYFNVLRYFALFCNVEASCVASL